MANDEIYNWLDRPFHELNSAEQEAVLREIDEHEYVELHALHKMSAGEASYHLREADEMIVPPLIRSKTVKLRRVPFWAAAACTALAVICTRVFWTREIQIPVTVVKYDTLQLREKVTMKALDTAKVFVAGPVKSRNKNPVKRNSNPEISLNLSEIGPTLGDLQTGVVETGSVPAGQRSLAENKLAQEFRYVRM